MLGILFAQHAAIASLPAAGVDITGAAAPAAAIGHSQGVLGVALLQALTRADTIDEEQVVEVHAIYAEWRPVLESYDPPRFAVA